MANDIQSKRRLIQGAYKFSPNWQDKVKAMSDDQVIAVYFRLKRKNQI